jgi:HEAT repeat protein
LIEALHDREINVRVSAARALGKIGDKSALAALTDAMKDDTQTTSWKPTTLKETASEAIRQIQEAKR